MDRSGSVERRTPVGIERIETPGSAPLLTLGLLPGSIRRFAVVGRRLLYAWRLLALWLSGRRAGTLLVATRPLLAVGLAPLGIWAPGIRLLRVPRRGRTLRWGALRWHLRGRRLPRGLLVSLRRRTLIRAPLLGRRLLVRRRRPTESAGCGIAADSAQIVVVVAFTRGLRRLSRAECIRPWILAGIRIRRCVGG